MQARISSTALAGPFVTPTMVSSGPLDNRSHFHFLRSFSLSALGSLWARPSPPSFERRLGATAAFCTVLVWGHPCIREGQGSRSRELLRKSVPTSQSRTQFIVDVRPLNAVGKPTGTRGTGRYWIGGAQDLDENIASNV